MVNILRRASASPVLDERAMQTFRHQWQVYSKVVDNEYLSHQAVGAVLHRELVAEVNRPFRFLDLACGDARLTVAALQGTPVVHYHAIDLSAPALALARQTVEALTCPAELEQGDFVSAMRERPEPADVVWIGLSLHHLQTPDKKVLMREVRAAVGDGGRFLIYEPDWFVHRVLLPALNSQVSRQRQREGKPAGRRHNDYWRDRAHLYSRTGSRPLSAKQTRRDLTSRRSQPAGRFESNNLMSLFFAQKGFESTDGHSML